jgi:hypothetical protein
MILLGLLSRFSRTTSSSLVEGIKTFEREYGSLDVENRAYSNTFEGSWQVISQSIQRTNLECMCEYVNYVLEYSILFGGFAVCSVFVIMNRDSVHRFVTSGFSSFRGFDTRNVGRGFVESGRAVAELATTSSSEASVSLTTVIRVGGLDLSYMRFTRSGFFRELLNMLRVYLNRN